MCSLPPVAHLSALHSCNRLPQSTDVRSIILSPAAFVHCPYIYSQQFVLSPFVCVMVFCIVGLSSCVLILVRVMVLSSGRVKACVMVSGGP